MSRSGEQEQLPLEKHEASTPVSQPKSHLYAQLNTSVRPLDRLRRPAPSDDADFSQLVDDLNFSFNNETSIEAKPSPVTKIEVEHQAEQQPEVTVATNAQPLTFTPAQPKRSRLPKFFKPLAVLILIAFSTAVGYAAASLFIKPSQPAANSQASSQSDAEWRKAQAQWECTLKQYQAKQAAQTNNQPVKEVSCAN